MTRTKTILKIIGMFSVLGLIGFYVLAGGYEIFARNLSEFVWTYKNTLSLAIAGILGVFSILGIDKVAFSEDEQSLKSLHIVVIITILVLIIFKIIEVWQMVG